LSHARKYSVNVWEGKLRINTEKTFNDNDAIYTVYFFVQFVLFGWSKFLWSRLRDHRWKSEASSLSKPGTERVQACTR